MVPEAKPLAPPKTAKSALLFYRKENLGRVAEANPDLEVGDALPRSPARAHRAPPTPPAPPHPARRSPR